MIARRQPPVKQNPQSFLHPRKIAENRRKTQKRCNFNLQIGCGLDRQNDLKWLPLRFSHVQRKNYFIFRNSGKSADFPELPFHRWGRGEKRHLQRRFLRKRGAAGGRSLPLGGAVAQRLRGYKWRSEKSVKAIAPTGAALAFLCFDFFFRIVKGVQPLTRCGVGGVQR